jgi:hypothetical protein
MVEPLHHTMGNASAVLFRDGFVNPAIGFRGGRRPATEEDDQAKRKPRAGESGAFLDIKHLE